MDNFVGGVYRFMLLFASGLIISLALVGLNTPTGLGMAAWFIALVFVLVAPPELMD